MQDGINFSFRQHRGFTISQDCKSYYAMNLLIDYYRDDRLHFPSLALLIDLVIQYNRYDIIYDQRIRHMHSPPGSVPKIYSELFLDSNRKINIEMDRIYNKILNDDLVKASLNNLWFRPNEIGNYHTEHLRKSRKFVRIIEQLESVINYVIQENNRIHRTCYKVYNIAFTHELLDTVTDIETINNHVETRNNHVDIYTKSNPLTRYTDTTKYAIININRDINISLPIKCFHGFYDTLVSAV